MTAHPLRVGVVVVQNIPWRAWRERVIEVERLGFDAVHVWDHLVHRTQEPTDPLFDGLTSLAAAAAFTTRVRLGTLVAVPLFRHPAVLANQAMTIDQASGGRLELGIGAGGAVLDHGVVGVPEWSAGERFERFRDTVEMVDHILRGGSDYVGTHYSTRGATVAPGPVQQPRPPLTIAAHGPRTLRVAARLADTWNSIAARDVPRDGVLAQAGERARLLDALAVEVGRDPAVVRRSVLVGSEAWPVLSSVGAFRDAVLRYRELGFTQFDLIQPGHPAEAAIAHGPADPDIVRRIAEILPDLRAEVG